MWGNGESSFALLRTVFLVLLAVAVVDVIVRDRVLTDLTSYISATLSTPQIFLGIEAPETYPKGLLALITAVRLVLFGLFIAILNKRFTRR